MGLISLLWGIVAMIWMVVALIPFLGWGNWFLIPFAAIGAVIAAIGIALTRTENRGRAKAGLDQLDPLTRRCLLAQRLEGVSYAEIAAREGLPLTTVEKRVARAVLFLMKWMDDW